MKEMKVERRRKVERREAMAEKKMKWEEGKIRLTYI